MADDKLTQQVKRKLNITWDDAVTNSRVADIIATAKSVLVYRLGIGTENYDFSAPGIVNELFLSYCLYAWSHAEDEFVPNYQDAIYAARALFSVEQAGDIGND